MVSWITAQRGLVLASFSISALILGCGGPNSEEPQMSKDEAKKVGKAEWPFDFCEKFGWYRDGSCDKFCPNPDPDCQSANVGCQKDADCFSAGGAFCHITNHSNAAYDPPRPPSTEGRCVIRDGNLCNVDADCAMGFKCQGDCGMGKCSGSCQPAIEVSDGCIADWGCKSGETCLYTIATDPTTGKTTLRGECRSKNSGLCNVSSDCPAGNGCFSSSGMHKTWGECRPDGCDVAGKTCGCKDDSQCLSRAGAFCHITNHSNGAYDPPLPPSNEGQCLRRDGELCNVDADCAKGFKCQGDCGMGRCAGRCLLTIDVKEGCMGDWACKAGEACYYYIATNPNDGKSTINGECRAKNSGFCNQDSDCADGKTCINSAGMHKAWGECHDL
jgi:hypothetical protein